MKAGRLAIIALLLGLATCGWARHALAYATEGLTWAGGQTTFYSNVIGGTTFENLDMLFAMSAWSDVTPFVFNAVQSTADPCNHNGPNGVSMASTNCGAAFGSNVLAITTYTYTGTLNVNAHFVHAGTVFNSGYNFLTYHGALIYGEPDFGRVAVHELGHVLGLAHETNSAIPAIMAPDISSIETPTADDIAGVDSLYPPIPPPAVSLVSAVLPSSRSVQIGNAATAFATIINSGTQTGTGCAISLASSVSASLSFQTTSSSTNQITGTPNQAVNIAANSSQSFIVSVTPTAAFTATDVAFNMRCTNGPAATSTTGLNTLLLSASMTPAPDIVALAATAQRDGYVHVGLGSSSGAFAVATVNVGAASTITASADTGSATLPVSINLCQTNPTTGQCVSAIGPTVQTTIAANQTPTFAVFVGTSTVIGPDPANKRIFVRFRDPGGVTRGSTSVAVTSF